MKRRSLRNTKTFITMLLTGLIIMSSQALFAYAEEATEYVEETVYTEETQAEETTVYVSPDEVKNEIAALPAINAIKYADSEQIKNIRAKYDALTDEDKALVDNFATLESAQQRILLLEELTNATYSFSYRFESGEETVLKIVYAETQPSIMMLSPAGEEYVILTEAMAKDDSKTISEDNFELTITTVADEDALLFTITRCESGLWKINSSSPVSITTQEEEETTTAAPVTVGDWTVTGLAADEIPEDVLTLFQNSVSTDFTLTQYLGIRQGETTEHGFLCSCNDGYRILVLTTDAEGNTAISRMINYEPEEGEDVTLSTTKMLELINSEPETTAEPETTTDTEPLTGFELSSEMITLIVIVAATAGLIVAVILILKKVLKHGKKDDEKETKEEPETKEAKKEKKKPSKKMEKDEDKEKKEKPAPEKKDNKKKAFVPRTEDIVQLTEEEELERIKRESDALYAKVGGIAPKKEEKQETGDSSDSYYVVTQEDLDNDITIEEYTLEDEDSTAEPGKMSEGVRARRTFFPEDRFN